MSTYQPAYRVVIYKPRSEEAAETTVLTPVAGAPHSNQFAVATLPNINVSGVIHQPYLDTVRGRRSAINFLTGRTDVGELELRLIDKRLNVSGSNLERWVTAYAGSTKGRDRLKGCKVEIYESLNAGSTWSLFFTGRVQRWRISQRNVALIQVREGNADALKQRVFVGRPHSSITTSGFPWLLPLGLERAYGGVAATAPLTGTYKSAAEAGGAVRIIDLDGDSQDRRDNLVTKVLVKEDRGIGSRRRTWSEPFLPARVYFKRLDTQATGEFQLRALHSIGERGDKGYVKALQVELLPSNDPNFIAFPPSNVSCEVAIRPIGEPTEQAPLYVAEQHPAQFAKDLLDGKYGHLKSDGSVLNTVPYDATAINNLIADTSFEKGRWVFSGSEQLDEVLEKRICLPFGLAYRWGSDGKLVLLDARRPSSSPTSTAITTADLAVPEAPDWETNAEDAITWLKSFIVTEGRVNLGELHESDPRVPDVRTSLITESELPLILAEGTALTDLGLKDYEVDGSGYRSMSATSSQNQASIVRARRALERRLAELQTMYGRGPTTIVLPCRRVAAVSNCFPGDWRLLQTDEQVDYTTNRRGGTRLARCEERREDGPVIYLTFVDSGENAAATVPTFTSIAQAADAKYAVDATLSVNADSDPIEVHYAITDTAVGTRPTESDALWTRAGVLTASGTLLINRLTSGKRVWVRARSLPNNDVRFRLPSTWVFPTTPAAGYIDTATVTAPSGLAESSISAYRATLSWTNGESTLPVRVLLALDGQPLVVIATLPAGSTRLTVTSLQASTIYDWGVEHLGEFESAGSRATDTFTTTSTPDVAPAITDVPLIVVTTGANPTELIDVDVNTPSGIYIRVRPADTTIGVEIQRNTAQQEAGAVSLGVLPAGELFYLDPLPITGTVYYYRTRHVGSGYDPGAWSGWSDAAQSGVVPEYLPTGELTPFELGTGDVVPVEQGGTAIVSYTVGAMLWAQAATVLAQVSPNTDATRKFLRQISSGQPVFDTVLASDVQTGTFPSGTFTFPGPVVVGTVTGSPAAGIFAVQSGLHIGSTYTAPPADGLRVEGTVIFEGELRTGAVSGGVHVGSTYTAPPAGGLRTEGQIIVEAGGLTITAGGLTVSAGTISASGIATTVGALTATTGTFSGLLTAQAGLTVTPAAAGVALGHLVNGGIGQTGVDIGDTATVVIGDRSARLGFRGFGIQHGQIAWHVGIGFKLVDSSAASPSGDYGANPTLVPLFAGAFTASGDVVVQKADPTIELNRTTATVRRYYFTVNSAAELGVYDATAGAFRLKWDMTGAANFQGNTVSMGALTATTGIFASTTTPQLSFRYDASNRLDITISSTGAVTYDAVGSGALHTFSDDVTIGSLGRFDSTDTPSEGQLLIYKAGAINKWQAETLLTLYVAGDTRSELKGDNTAVQYLLADPGTAGPGATPDTPSTPVVHAENLAFTLEIRDYSKNSNFRYFEWEYCTGTQCTGFTPLATTTSTKLVHSRLAEGTIYRYRVRAVGRDGDLTAFGTTGDNTAARNSQTHAFGAIIASEIAVASLAAISANIGIITSGQLRNAGNTAGVNLGGAGGIPGGWTMGINFESGATVSGMTRYLNFAATGSGSFLKHEKLDLRVDGAAIFSGQIDITVAQVQQTVGDMHVVLRDPDVAHGMTGVVSTDVLGAIGPHSGTAGGVAILGFSESSGVGVRIAGYVDNSAGSNVGVQFRSWQKSGTSFTDPGAGMVPFEWYAGNTLAMDVFYTGLVRTYVGLQVAGAGLAVTAGPSRMRKWLYLNDDASLGTGSGGDARGAVVWGATDTQESWFAGPITSAARASAIWGLFGWQGNDWAIQVSPALVVNVYSGTLTVGKDAHSVEASIKINTAAAQQAAMYWQKAGSNKWALYVPASSEALVWWYNDGTGNRLRLTTTTLEPTSNNAMALGTSSLKYSELHLQHRVLINGNVNPHVGLNNATYQGYLEITSDNLRVYYNGSERLRFEPTVQNTVAESIFRFKNNLEMDYATNTDTGTQNSWSPPNAPIVIWKGASSLTVNGIVNTSRRFFFIVKGASNALTFNHNSGSAVSGQKIIVPAGVNFSPSADGICALWYDDDLANWRLLPLD